MLKRIMTFSIIMLAISCGKDVVIIEDPVPQEETDETFEVNLVGFATAEENEFVPDATILIDGQNSTSDDSGFFHFEKILIGQKGKVIHVQRDGYLPTIHRVANHQNLETVISNLILVKAPESVSVNSTGGIINDDFGTLSISENAVNSNTDFVFKTFMGEKTNVGNDDQLFVGFETKYLLKEVSVYLEGDAPLNSNATISLNTDGFKEDDISNLYVFHFNEQEDAWQQRDIDLIREGGEIQFSIQEYGWWTVAKSVPAVYATLNLSQVVETDLNNVATTLTFDNDNYIGSTFYTSNDGSISTYFPIESSITAKLNNGQFAEEFSAGFTLSNTLQTIQFGEEVQVPFDGLVYTCDFDFANGYVAIIENGQHKIKEIQNGQFNTESYDAGGDILLQFYSDSYEFISSKKSNFETLKAGVNNFFSCNDLNDNLSVISGTSLLQDFEECRVKVRPNETVVIGEGNDEVFLLSFDGDTEGIYEGLIYFPLITDTDVNAEVMVNIVLYDGEENKIGGFVKTNYITNNEELIISFIGNVE